MCAARPLGPEASLDDIYAGLAYWGAHRPTPAWYRLFAQWGPRAGRNVFFAWALLHMVSPLPVIHDGYIERLEARCGHLIATAPCCAYNWMLSRTLPVHLPILILVRMRRDAAFSVLCPRHSTHQPPPDLFMYLWCLACETPSLRVQALEQLMFPSVVERLSQLSSPMLLHLTARNAAHLVPLIVAFSHDLLDCSDEALVPFVEMGMRLFSMIFRGYLEDACVSWSLHRRARLMPKLAHVPQATFILLFSGTTPATRRTFLDVFCIRMLDSALCRTVSRMCLGRSSAVVEVDGTIEPMSVYLQRMCDTIAGVDASCLARMRAACQ